MTKKQLIQLFEDRKVRTVWDDELQKWFFSIVDVCHVLTDSKDYQTARKYWNKLKERLKKEGNESVTNCHQLKLEAADGKKYKTDVADFEQLFRLIQSIPSLLTICHQLTNGRNYLKILIYNIEEPSPCYI
jgi:hypothetical protein